jgi:class 3 adenylate cyclase/tetratricopeptide (TPR) repeat protein
MPNCSACRAVPADSSRFCQACGAPADARPSPDERKLATVLFADLVGSTELGSSQDPERTRAVLERFYDAMQVEIEAAGGSVEKFVGDAVMAAFGAPSAQEDHAERALHAALSMRRRLEELFGDELQLRIGVNTGEVVVGRPREGSSFVTGDAVNVAARLEQAAPPGEILVGERTVAAARGAFEFGEPQTVEAKGKEGGAACRRLLRALSLMRPRGVAGLRRAFVGRESELELLQATYRRAIDLREPHLVTIMGDAGVGKTRLVRELWEWLAAQEPQPLQRTGRCLPYGRVSYWALGEVLKEHLGILESDSPEAVNRRLDGREILGLALGLDVAGDLHPLAARDRLHEAWVDFLDELTRESAAVVLLEDLHWADEPLLDLLDRLLRDVHGPLLLLGTARPELLDRRPAWGGGRRNVSALWLEALSEEESARLLDELLEADLPLRLREVVVGGAEGNPFFVEELLATLIDQGVLTRDDGRWSVRERPEGFAVPDSVQALLAARIDLLGPSEKAGLQAASVIGRIFWRGPVRELLDGAEPDFAKLEDRDFIRRRSGSMMVGEEEYAFKHQLTREVAYASLPKARRAHLHAAFADWIGRSQAGDELAAILAHHYAEAVRPEDADLAWADRDRDLAELRAKAIVWLRRAGAQAIARYDIDDGLALLRRALELEEEREQRARILFEIGRAYALKFDGERFWTTMEQAIELTGDEELAAEAYAELAMQTAGRAGMWKQMPDGVLVESWIEQALALAPPDSRARAAALIGRAMWRLDANSALEASRVAEGLGEADLRASAWASRAFAHSRAGDYGEALAWAQRGFDILADIRDPDIAADVYGAALIATLGSGRFREGRRLAAQHNELVSRLTPHHRVHGLGILLEVEELAAGWEQILALEAAATVAIEANLETPCVRNPRSLLVCGLAHAQIGDVKSALRLESQADEMGYDARVALAGPYIRLALARGDLDAAEESLAWLSSVGPASSWFALSAVSAKLDALAALGDRAAVEAEAQLHARPGTYLEPFALRALGRVRKDDQLVAQALDRFEKLGLDWHAEQTRALLAV